METPNIISGSDCMVVFVEVSSWFKRYTGGSRRVELDVSHGTTAVQAAVAAGIPENEIGFLIMENRKVENDCILSDRSTIKVYPHIIGG